MSTAQETELNMANLEEVLVRMRNAMVDSTSLAMQPRYIVVPARLHYDARRILFNLHQRQVRARRRGARGRAYSLKWRVA